MKTFDMMKKYGMFALLAGGFLLTSCDEDDGTDVPPEENEEEVITDVKLIFTDAAGGTVEATAQDPDGEGALELVVADAINLDTGTTYTLTFEILNALDDPAEDIGEEIEEEDDEHQIFFSFSEGAFSDPAGDGNIDNRDDPINYNDTDDNGFPVGLNTTWTTSSDTLAGGTFTARLQHQPDVKNATSTSTDGGTDFDLEFVLNINK